MSEPMEKLVEPVTADVSAQRIARVYAEALYKAAEAKGEAKELLDELTSLVHDVFRANGALEMYLGSGAVGRGHKRDLLKKSFDGRASETLTNFLLVLNNHDRLDLLRPILKAYQDLYEERTGHMVAEVRSARPLSEQQAERLRRELRETFRREPILAARVDEDLLGGLMIRVGDWVYDATVRTQLETLRNQLIERSSHAIQSGRDRFSDRG
jgi:F-type H+-transporting ATPase subunit delta